MKAKQDILNFVLAKLNRRRKKHRITNIDISQYDNSADAIRMDIDGKRFRIASLGWDNYMVEEVKGGILSSNDAALKIAKELL